MKLLNNYLYFLLIMYIFMLIHFILFLILIQVNHSTFYNYLQIILMDPSLNFLLYLLHFLNNQPFLTNYYLNVDKYLQQILNSNL
jgi:hypothetical protein